MKHRSRIAISLGTGGVIIGLLAISFVNFFYRSDIVTSTVITQDIKRLSGIFQTIHEQCTILGFDNQQNRINFLNTCNFTGSEVGPMNLARPEKWQGPYVQDNPTIQSKEFMVVRTKQGYFITPGKGVRLPNGKVIGKDIVLDENADIESMMGNKNGLSFKGESFAQKLMI